MITINLTQTQVAIVDDENYEWLSQYTWSAIRNSSGYYAARGVQTNSGQRFLYMHREILSASFDLSNFDVDHIDLNGLNNQVYNLRPCTPSQNGINRPAQSNNKSGFKGVSWDKKNSKWRSTISHNKVDINLGRYSDKESAAIAYDLKAIELFGSYAFTNYPMESYFVK